MKKYKIGQVLIYTPLNKGCKVICNQLEPGGDNADTALITVMVEKMAHPVTIPVRVQDDFLTDGLPQTGFLKKLFRR